jgi:hypothetical protein
MPHRVRPKDGPHSTAARQGPVRPHIPRPVSPSTFEDLRIVKGTHPPAPGRHVPTKERDGPSEPIALCGTDDPLEDSPVRARTTAARFRGVVDPAMVTLCACVDDARDRGGGGTEEGKVDPSGVFVRPWICIASLTIGRAGRVVRGGVREGDEFEVGAVAEDLCGLEQMICTLVGTVTMWKCSPTTSAFAERPPAWIPPAMML